MAFTIRCCTYISELTLNRLWSSFQGTRTTDISQTVANITGFPCFPTHTKITGSPPCFLKSVYMISQLHTTHTHGLENIIITLKRRLLKQFPAPRLQPPFIDTFSRWMKNEYHVPCRHAFELFITGRRWLVNVTPRCRPHRRRMIKNNDYGHVFNCLLLRKTPLPIWGCRYPWIEWRQVLEVNGDKIGTPRVSPLVFTLTHTHTTPPGWKGERNMARKREQSLDITITLHSQLTQYALCSNRDHETQSNVEYDKHNV